MQRIFTELTKVQELLSTIAINNKEIMNVDEASLFLKVSKSLLYKLTSTNGIPHYKPSKKLIYFKRTELEEWALRNPIHEIK